MRVKLFESWNSKTKRYPSRISMDDWSNKKDEWRKGNCKYSLNISVVSSILDVIAKDITFNYRLVTREDLEEIKDNIKHDIEEILL